MATKTLNLDYINIFVININFYKVRYHFHSRCWLCIPCNNSFQKKVTHTTGIAIIRLFISVIIFKVFLKCTSGKVNNLVILNSWQPIDQKGALHIVLKIILNE